MQNIETFDEAVNYLQTIDLIAPAYFILAGIKPGEGIIITRNQYKTIDSWKLNESQDRWYLLQTNYDRWTQPPADDDRRTPGIIAMNKTTQFNINSETLYDVLSIYPVCNK
jgi:hypothetical protein